MREFKFRVFNKETEIMYYPESTQEEFNHYFQIGSGGFWLYDKEGKLICTSNHGDILMQYTGLKDKNGKEIYEGDIVGKGKGEIYWDEKLAQFRVRWHERVFKNVRGSSGESLFVNSVIVWEVLGNIYEHPSLITPADKTATI